MNFSRLEASTLVTYIHFGARRHVSSSNIEDYILRLICSLLTHVVALIPKFPNTRIPLDRMLLKRESCLPAEQFCGWFGGGTAERWADGWSGSLVGDVHGCLILGFCCTLRIGECRVVTIGILAWCLVWGFAQMGDDDDVMVGVFGCAFWGAAGMGGGEVRSTVRGMDGS